MDAVDASVQTLHRVGPALRVKLEKIGLEAVRDLLFHLPLRYEDRTKVSPIGGLQPGMDVVLHARIALSQVKFGRRRSLVVRIQDGTGQLDLRFFHFSESQRRGFAQGKWIYCYGQVRRGAVGLELVHPEYQLLTEHDTPPLEDALTPVYPTTDGLGQGVLRRLCEQALAIAEKEGGLKDWLEDSELLGGNTLSLLEAIKHLHHPPKATRKQHLEHNRNKAVERLALEELLAHQLSHRAIRAQLDTRTAPIIRGRSGLTEKFKSNLGFQLTDAQARVVKEVWHDLSRARPMYRLVQGDVGSGKTVVAALAVLQTVASGRQAAVMAPTELLAEQHLRSFVKWFEPLGLRVVWLGGKQTARERREVLNALADGQASIAVGTHALFQDQVRFAALALAVIDEQHRFGVDQRQALLAKGPSDVDSPHQLIMTATPIPRTLAMAGCAHLDISSIDELPPGRKEVETVVVSQARRDQLIERVASACAGGSQAYWVCPLIEESDSLQAEAAEDTATLLAESLPTLTTGLVHGRMKPAERDLVMARFRDGEVDLLVATTVIEVGVDVPNASLMVIENAERMGLSQLHQLRGRVGRGTQRSHCVLLYKGPLSHTATSRLAVMRESTDGFVISEKDLELRGPGEVLGTRQTGDIRLRVADLGRDIDLVDKAVEIAPALIKATPQAQEALVERWIGRAVDYGEVG